MRVLFIINDLRLGGKERQCVTLIKNLVETSSARCELVVIKPLIEYTEIYKIGIPLHILQQESKNDIAKIFKLFKIFF